MKWDWGYVSSVVPDFEIAARFYEESLQMSRVAEVEIDSIQAKGVFLGLGSNCLLALLEPTGPGAAQRFLLHHGGGLYHLCLIAPKAVIPRGSPSMVSPLGGGWMVGGESEDNMIMLELIHERLCNSNVIPLSSGPIIELDHVATIVPDLGRALDTLASMGFHKDPAASHWIFPYLQTENAVLPARSGYLELNQAYTAEGLFGKLQATRRGAAIVGLTLAVNDLNNLVEALRSDGRQITDPASVIANVPGENGTRNLGQTAVVSMKDSGGTRLFLFEPSEQAPRY